MAPSISIPPRLAKEFFEAVREYLRWHLGDPEPSITSIATWSGSALYVGRVDNFTDALPDEVFYALCFLMDGAHTRLKNELRGDRTYATAARCFLELIEDKKRRFSASDERQRSG
jgi:hypothetical protein